MSSDGLRTTRPSAGDGCDRGQLSLSAVEGAVGVLLVLGALGSFLAGVPAADRDAAALDRTAADAATVLSGESPRHAGGTRLAEVARSPSAFERERDALERRVVDVLPENVMFQVRTPHGAVGYDPPDGVAVGVATVPTRYGDVTIRVWYA
ncbi:hypothetical protein G9C85_11365 [Halorubellus sp. JP-L1]|uniref:DUF7262 family protein n=1 Tax=Halorubellus sp. JP-L1 TaxID=2715753 RepID=UPI00140CB332|nr:hypothetical protein [Halorubellus sp. JP-L1]NHN42219.1 hypothetical protein [Halorubellus sp. JP-L1]